MTQCLLYKTTRYRKCHYTSYYIFIFIHLSKYCVTLHIIMITEACLSVEGDISAEMQSLTWTPNTPLRKYHSLEGSLWLQLSPISYLCAHLGKEIQHRGDRILAAASTLSSDILVILVGFDGIRDLKENPLDLAKTGEHNYHRNRSMYMYIHVNIQYVYIIPYAL